ncbi:MAG TPA: PP2C family protein-serine/threonine phosphatase [Jatrophihabitantaceae bacterium]|nr:PP2C family protein-serine/threonine phosphatase [Jatrophihabitantaceae bacterium]
MDAEPTGGQRSAPEAAFYAILAEAHVAAPHDLPALIRRHAAAFGATDARCFLTDLQQTVLVPFLEPRGADAGEMLEPLPIDSTVAGRAFQEVQLIVQHHVGGAAGATVWIPLLDGTERLGVLAASVDDADADRFSGPGGAPLRAFASLLGELIMTKTMYGDSVVKLRRQAEMGLAAEMQWSLLPPLTFACPDVAIAALLEPAYEVAGDTIDYAVDPGIARVAVFDGMGHGLRSAQLAAMSVATYRHARRAGLSLLETCRHIDETLLETFASTSFTTAVLAEFDTATGVLNWINAGHPEPLLLRHAELVKPLHARPRPPLGMDLGWTGLSREPTLGAEQLEPGDCVLLYTDGVTDARSPAGAFFGEDRLVDLIARNLAAGLPPPESMRQVVRALLDHQQGRLTDDASLLLVQWRPDENVMQAGADGADGAASGG